MLKFERISYNEELNREEQMTSENFNYYFIEIVEKLILNC